MTQKFRLTMAQLNATVGDLAGNAAQALEAWTLAKGAGADMVMLPEMFVTGYQVQDLVLKPAFTRDAMAQIQGLAQSCDEGPAMGIGGPFRDETGLYNAYYILAGGRIQTVIKKHILPNDDVFDENASINRRMSLGLTGSATCGLVHRFAKMPGMRMCPRLWPNLVQKCCLCRTVRPMRGAKWIYAWRIWSRGWSKPGCHWSM